MRVRWWWGLAALPILAIGCSVFLLNSGWLQNEARRQVVSTLERATGGPVSIRDFNFDWRTLTLSCRDVLAGPAKLGLLQVELRWRSLWERRVDAARVLVDRPEIDIAELSGKGPSVPDVFSIQVNRYEILHGVVHVRAQNRSFSLRGEDLRAELSRDGSHGGFQFNLASKRVDVQTECCGPLHGEAVARGFWTPAGIEVKAWRASVGLEKGGKLTLEGQGSYRNAQGFQAKGMARGDFRGLAGETKFRYAGGELALQDVTADGFGGSFQGSAKARADRSWEFAGHLDRVELNQAATTLGWRKLPWVVRVSGPISGLSTTGVKGALRISGGLTGEVNMLAGSDGEVSFANSHLATKDSDLQFSGSERSGLAVNIQTRNLHEIGRALVLTKTGVALDQLVSLLPGGNAQFTGFLRFPRAQPLIAGVLTMRRFHAYQRDWEELEWKGEARREQLKAERLMLKGAGVQLSGAGEVGLRNWAVTDSSDIAAKGTISLANWNYGTRVKGSLTGTGEVRGTLAQPAGRGFIEVQDSELLGERVKRLQADTEFSGHDVRVSNGRLLDFAGDHLDFSGSYLGSKLEIQVQTNNFVLSHVQGISGVDGTLALHATVAGDIENRTFRPIAVDGSVALTDAGFSGKTIGNATGRMRTANGRVRLDFQGNLRQSPFSGSASVGLEEGNPVDGMVHLSKLQCGDCLPVAIPAIVSGSGSLEFQGKLLDWRRWTLRGRADELRIEAKAFPFALHSTAPTKFEFSRGAVMLDRLELAGTDTTLRVSGTADPKQMNLSADGTFSLKTLQLLDNNIETAQGVALLHASARGAIQKPTLAGTMQIRGGAIGLRGFANGLTKLNGALVFDQDRATIQNLTAEAGGGKLSLAGFVTFGGTSPLAYHLESHAEETRLRYANGVSVTTNANLRLTGTNKNSLLSGTARISHIVLNPNADIGNLLTNVATGALTPANQRPFASGLQFDVAIESAPNLVINTTLSRNVEAAISLRLHGTPEHPLLLGTISANQGDIRVFGGRYTINRGEVTFQNATRIEPVLDLDLGTQARGINVDLTISGTLSHLNISYRSDPPLQPRDIIALLTVGRTPQEAANVQTSQVSNDTTALASNPSSVLGQALAPPSGRLSKLFGVTNIKLDPLVQGLTNTPQSRLTLEQQISRAITVTYVTNLEQTSEQIFRLEWAINRQYSIIALRDNNGEFGVDLQYKKRFK